MSKISHKIEESFHYKSDRLEIDLYEVKELTE